MYRCPSSREITGVPVLPYSLFPTTVDDRGSTSYRRAHQRIVRECGNCGRFWSASSVRRAESFACWTLGVRQISSCQDAESNKARANASRARPLLCKSRRLILHARRCHSSLVFRRAVPPRSSSAHLRSVPDLDQTAWRPEWI